jgi:hypothetical protein
LRLFVRGITDEPDSRHSQLDRCYRARRGREERWHGAGGLAYAADAGGVPTVLHTDGLRSVRALTDAAAQVVQTHRTDEFGFPTLTVGPSNQPHQYTGEVRDLETEFVYLRARRYAPAIGRFV